MSCTSPIDITSGQVGKCELKCEYSFDYKDSNATITNNGNYIQLSYDQASTPPVEYNAVKYQVREVRVYSPSLHRYQGQQAPAEMLIMHSSGNNKLIVSIPLVISSSKSKTSRFMEQVADYLNTFVQSAGQTSSMGNATWNLNDFVPEKVYYSYKGTAPFSPCNGGYDFVVFSTANMAQATISNDTLSKIRQRIAPSNIGVKNNTYYISQAPAKASLESVSDDIYISCQPTSTSEEQEVVGGRKGEPTNFFQETADYIVKGDLLKNPITQVAIAALVMVGVYKVGTLVFHRKKSSS
jgi:carbonic anhydrase